LGGISSQVVRLAALAVSGWAGSWWTLRRTVMNVTALIKFRNEKIKEIVESAASSFVSHAIQYRNSRVARRTRRVPAGKIGRARIERKVYGYACTGLV
jgi:hypothetical protein